MTYVEQLQNIVRTLRSEHGCPWDRKQTHESIKPGCIEEAVEVLCRREDGAPPSARVRQTGQGYVRQAADGMEGNQGMGEVRSRVGRGLPTRRLCGGRAAFAEGQGAQEIAVGGGV